MNNKKLIMKQVLVDKRPDLAAINLFHSNPHFSLKLKLRWLQWMLGKGKSPDVNKFDLAHMAKSWLRDEV